MISSVPLPGEELARTIRQSSEKIGQNSPFDEILELADRGKITEDHSFRLIGRLWAIKRLMYYIYGNWAAGINLNEYPASIHYLLSKQQYDDSSHEMNYTDEILARKWVRTQSRMFKHAYCEHKAASRVTSLVFTYRALANYAHNIRLPALNLGPKVIELAWMKKFAEHYPDESVRRIFAGQIPETASHVQMGRFIVERFVVKDVDRKLTATETRVVCSDYLAVMREITDFVLQSKA